MAARRKSPLKLEAELGFTLRSGLAASAARVALLERIGETGSITAAAKAVGLSYKAAWDAVEQMNNLADRPLVERSTGGARGGGTRLTERGRELVQSFRALEAEHARFIASLNEAHAHSRDLRLIGRLSMQTSARNQFAGRVVRVTRGAVNDEIELALSGGERIVATVTHDSSESLGLREGAEAIALVKASSIIVAVDDGGPLRLSARNQLRGRVARLQAGAVNSEVVIALRGGNTVAAVVTKASAEALGLREGADVIALFKAPSVILAVAS